MLAFRHRIRTSICRCQPLPMPYTTYCTRFDNKDKTPRLFPFLQPYEVAYKDAEYIYNNSKKYGRTNKS